MVIETSNEGAVRAGGLVMAQTEPVRQAIFDAIAAGMEQFKSPGGEYRVPMPALVGSGEK